ncbi:hypothetical protein BDD12DRAFT_805583 [Trichophaea hybrida]|nr:hypothetical protein BDD12DRAFT_805583 [Trichophaea hybrida]
MTWMTSLGLQDNVCGAVIHVIAGVLAVAAPGLGGMKGKAAEGTRKWQGNSCFSIPRTKVCEEHISHMKQGENMTLKKSRLRKKIYAFPQLPDLRNIPCVVNVEARSSSIP